MTGNDLTLFNLLLGIEGIILILVMILIVLVIYGIVVLKTVSSRLNELRGTKNVISQNTSMLKELKDTLATIRDTMIRFDVTVLNNQKSMDENLKELKKALDEGFKEVKSKIRTITPP